METLQRKHARRSLMVGSALLALLAQASGETALTPGRVQCGDTITTHTQLTHDLECPGTDTPALWIDGEGVVLDLGGHTVRRIGSEPAWSRGIVVQSNSTVRSGTIQGFDFGYVLDASSTHYPEQVWLSQLVFRHNGSAVHNQSSGVTLTISDSLLIGNRTGLGSEQDAGFGTFEVRSTTFIGHQLALSANGHTVDVRDSNFSLNETVVWCPYGSVSFTSSRIVYNQVVGQITFGEFGYGFCGAASFVDTLIALNAALAPPSRPEWETFDFVLRHSRVFGNREGLQLRASTVTLQGSTWEYNSGGLSLADLPEYVPPALTGTISANRFLSNRGDGLRVLVPSTLTVSRNVAIGNTGWGLHAQGVIDGGGNVARGNRAGNCVGLLCAPR